MNTLKLIIKLLGFEFHCDRISQPHFLSRFLHYIAGGGCFIWIALVEFAVPLLFVSHFKRKKKTEVKNVQFQHWMLVSISKPTLNTPKCHVKANNQTKRTTSNAMIKWVRAQVHTHRYIQTANRSNNTNNEQRSEMIYKFIASKSEKCLYQMCDNLPVQNTSSGRQRFL